MSQSTTGPSPTTTQKHTLSYLIDPIRNWHSNGRLIALNAWIVLLLLTFVTTGYNDSIMNGLQSVPRWESAFDYPSGNKLGLLNAIQHVGALVAYPFAPHLSNSIGRRRAVWIGAAITCIGTAIQTASQSVGMFIGARFLIGFGNTFAAKAASKLIAEILCPTDRAPLKSLYNLLLYPGAIIAAWITFGSFGIRNSWAWRLPLLLQGVPSILQVLLILFAPESPRWLVKKGRDKEALRMLAYYRADGNEQDLRVQSEFREIKAVFDRNQTVSTDVGWKSLIDTHGNRKRMRLIIAIAFFSIWSGNGLFLHYLSKVLNQVGITQASTQLLVNGVLQVWIFVCALYASSSLNRLRRRLLVLVSVGLMILFYGAQAICFAVVARYGNHDGNGHKHKDDNGATDGDWDWDGGWDGNWDGAVAVGHAVIAFIFLFCVASNFTFTPFSRSYVGEILPFSLRSKGLRVFKIVTELAIILNQYVDPIGLEAFGWKYYVAYVVWLACEFLFLWFFLVETKNRTLEETAAVFDGDKTMYQLVREAA